MPIEVLGDGNPDGSTVTSSATELAGFHGSAVAQAATIATTGSTAASMRTRLNQIRTVLINKGLIAAS
jgi:hypothetical protein